MNKLTNSLTSRPVGWAVEYTDCIFADGKNPTKCFLVMTLNNLMASIQAWIFGECEPSRHCHCSQVHSNWELYNMTV